MSCGRSALAHVSLYKYAMRTKFAMFVERVARTADEELKCQFLRVLIARPNICAFLQASKRGVQTRQPYGSRWTTTQVTKSAYPIQPVQRAARERQSLHCTWTKVCCRARNIVASSKYCATRVQSGRRVVKRARQTMNCARQTQTTYDRHHR